jgi:hypothetical protein
MRAIAGGLLALFACGQPARAEDPRPVKSPPPPAEVVRHAPPAPAPAPTPGCIDDGKPYDEAAMRERLGFLGSAELDGRAPGTAGDLAARAFIVERFRCLGLVPAGTGDSYEQPFDASGATSANVLGYVKGSDATVGSEIIVVAAHHDHLGNGFLGANDNASGVVALLSIAQAIQQREIVPHRTILFATFGDEEDGMIGSYHYVAHAPEALPIDRVVQVINLDMVGSHSSKDFVAAMGTFKRLGSRKIMDELAPRFPKIHVGLGGVSRGSDFEPFCKLGIPYVFFWTPDARCYHQKCDTVDRIDFPHMVDITKLAGALTERLADSELDLAGLRRKLGCFAR